MDRFNLLIEIPPSPTHYPPVRRVPRGLRARTAFAFPSFGEGSPIPSTGPSWSIYEEPKKPKKPKKPTTKPLSPEKLEKKIEILKSIR